MKLEKISIKTPVGTLFGAVDGDALLALTFHDYWLDAARLVERKIGAIEWIESASRKSKPQSALERYVDGDLAALDVIDVRPAGTPFQQIVWTALRKIPVGTTTSYGALADSIGRPSAFRAVAMANARNPVGVVIPCHRVIGSDGELRGYAGGLERKAWLLAHEASADSVFGKWASTAKMPIKQLQFEALGNHR